MAGHVENGVERYCELPGQSVSALKQVETLCTGDHQSSPEDSSCTKELAPICEQIVSKCLYVARIGRRELLRTVNILALSVTRWIGKKVGTIDKLHQSNETLQTILSC